MLQCGATLRPWQSTAGQGSPAPELLPHLQQQDELILSQRAESAVCRGPGLAASQASRRQGHRERRPRDSKGPRVFPNHWTPATAAAPQRDTTSRVQTL